jgi:hypothetical protein
MVFYENADLETIQEMLTVGWQRVYFQYDNNNYLVEYQDLGFIIVEPFVFEDEGGNPEETNAAYPGHLQAKTPEDFLRLAFLDGKTLLERFDELRFFDI